MKKSKLFMIVMILVFFVVSTISCAQDVEKSDDTEVIETLPEENVEQSEPEPVEITFWHNYGADKESPYIEDVIIPMFHDKYPNIIVKVIAQGNEGYRQQIVVNAATKEAPDVARLDLTDIAGLAELGALAPLDDFDGFDALKDQIFEGAMSTNYFKGNYYAMPLGTNCKAAVFNMNTLAEMGLSEVPKTMEEFFEASANAGKYTINVSSVGEWDIMPYFWLFGGTVTNDEFSVASGYLDSQESIDAVNKIVELHKDGIFTIKEIDGSVDAWDGIKSGEYATFIEGPWFFAFTGDWKELGLKPSTIPTYNGKTTSVLGGESIGVLKSSEHKDEAFTFIEFMLSEEVQTLLGSEVGQMPVNKASAKDQELVSDEVWSVYLEQLETAQTRVPSPDSPTIQEYIKDAFESILVGDVSTEEGLKQAAELIDGVLAQ